MKKSDLKIPEIQAPIKVGSQVVFKDGSYTLSILHNKYELKSSYPGLSEDIWTVVAINVTLPTGTNHESLVQSGNNCIVKNEIGDIVFCSNINISNIKEISIEEPAFVLLTEEERESQNKRKAFRNEVVFEDDYDYPEDY